MAALVAAAALACGRRSPEPALLPDAVGEWTATAETSEFVGDDLFVYINGGAEIYHEHGFDRLAVREYGRGDERVAAELYTMAGSAFGIYSYARSASGRPLDLGAGGTLADYYLHFWSGPHLVAVTARDGPGDAQAAVLELGTLLGANFPGSGEPPQLMELLPVEGCVPGSKRHVAGPIGLNNAAPRVAAFFRGFEEAAVSRCRSATGEEALLVVLRWTDPAAAARGVSEARERAASTEGIDGAPVDETGFNFHFDEDETMVGARTGVLVRLAVARGGDEPHLDRLFPIDNWEASHE
jgi:heme-degrading monooxygenase HmoA